VHIPVFEIANAPATEMIDILNSPDKTQKHEIQILYKVGLQKNLNLPNFVEFRNYLRYLKSEKSNF
jgi:hypothetical protein